MADKKKTQREFFNEIIAMAEAQGRTDLVEFAKERIGALDKKSANKKPTKTQEANVSLKETIANVLRENGKAMTVTEIIASGEFEALTTPQKISALLKQMVEVDHTAIKTVEKKKSYFSAVVEAEADENEAEEETDAE
jgi:hypothetical protein